MKHIIISGSIGILLAAQAGCGADEGPPWPQADAEQATRSIMIMALSASSAAGAQPPAADGTLNAEASCATGGTTEVSGSISGTVDGNVIVATVEMDMTMIACGFQGSTMDGTLTHVETGRIDSTTDSIEVNGSTAGRVTFAGALAGTCAVALTWEIDPLATIVIGGRACGQDVSFILNGPNAPPNNDQVWDQDEVEIIAEGIMHSGDESARVVDGEYDQAPSPVVEVMDLVNPFCPDGGQTITGTRTETTVGNTFTIEHTLTIMLDECPTISLPMVSGMLEYRRVDQVDLDTGEHTITADISGQVTSSVPWLPSSACALDLHQVSNPATRDASVTGTACGQAVSFTNPFAYIPRVSDQIWDREKAEEVAREIFEVGTEAKRTLDDEHATAPSPVVEVMDLTSDCFFGGSQTITGTRTETTVGSTTTIEYALSLVLDACDVSLSETSGTLEYLRVEEHDDNTGALTITADISGEVTVSDSFLPSSPCALDLHRDGDLAAGSAFTTGTACGRSISFDF